MPTWVLVTAFIVGVALVAASLAIEKSESSRGVIQVNNSPPTAFESHRSGRYLGFWGKLGAVLALGSLAIMLFR